MSDAPAAQAPTADTPDPAAPGAPGTPGSEVNWQERYSSLQPEYTRASQEAAQYRSLIEAARQGDPDAISQLGFEIDDGDPAVDDTPPDELTAALARLEALEQRDQAREQERHQASVLAAAEAHIERELGAIDGLDKADARWVIDHALALPPNAENLPDIATAYAEFTAWDTARQQQQVAARKRPPRIPVGGQEGTDAPDFDTMSRSDIDAWMAEKARADSE